jgi:hypothetical protein
MVSNICPENLAVCEIVWKNIGTVIQATDDSMTRRMRIVCRVPQATNHGQYMQLIWLRIGTGDFECGNELMNSIRYGELVDKLKNW